MTTYVDVVERKDTITIDIDVSANITAGIFEIPDDYSIS